jgi:hypothetical protein
VHDCGYPMESLEYWAKIVADEVGLEYGLRNCNASRAFLPMDQACAVSQVVIRGDDAWECWAGAIVAEYGDKDDMISAKAELLKMAAEYTIETYYAALSGAPFDEDFTAPAEPMIPWGDDGE